MQRRILLGVTVVFSGLSAAALWQHGYWGMWQALLQSLATLQGLADLVLALGMVLVWVWHDARRSGRLFWPYLVLTLASGSFGPLLYLWLRKAEPAQTNLPGPRVH